MKMRKIYIVGELGVNYINWMNGVRVNFLNEADLVLFTGGEDVDPSMYDAPRHPFTRSNLARDRREIMDYWAAKQLGKKLIGICRGAQFLCVMAGGDLVQHQANPSMVHPITTLDGRELLVTSTHHQAQWPYLLEEGKEYKMLGWSVGMSPFHHDGEQLEIVLGAVDGDKEAEVVYYPHIKALGIQPHPEMMWPERDRNPEIMKSMVWFQSLLDKHMEGKL